MKPGPNSQEAWETLIAAVRERTAVSSAELEKLVRKYTTITSNYALRRLQREGVLSKVGEDRKLLYLVGGGSRKIVKEPLAAVQVLYGDDAVFGYGTALFLHGVSRYGQLSDVYVLAGQTARRRTVGSVVVRQVKSPLREQVGVIEHRYGKRNVRVTDLERTLVDCIHRPKYAQGWENVVHALRRSEKIAPRKLVDYVKQYRTPSLVAKVGVTLEQFRGKWNVAANDIGSLRSYLHRTPVEFMRGKGGKLNKTWNLYVPEGLFDE